MSLLKALSLEPMNISRLRSEVRFDIGATCICDGPEQVANEKAQTMRGCSWNPLMTTNAGPIIGTHLEFRTTRDGNAYSWQEFVGFFGDPYAATAWIRSEMATRAEKHEALLRQLREIAEKTKIKQLLPALRHRLVDDGPVKLVLAFAFPNASAILPDLR